jgi:hypothetical protein
MILRPAFLSLRPPAPFAGDRPRQPEISQAHAGGNS